MARNNSNTIDMDALSPEVRAFIEGLQGENTELAKTLQDATDTITKTSRKTKGTIFIEETALKSWRRLKTT